MQNDNITILKITNIIWGNNSKNYQKLPKELDLQWNSLEWTNKEVSIWLSKQFNATLKDFDIHKIQNKEKES